MFESLSCAGKIYGLSRMVIMLLTYCLTSSVGATSHDGCFASEYGSVEVGCAVHSTMYVVFLVAVAEMLHAISSFLY